MVQGGLTPPWEWLGPGPWALVRHSTPTGPGSPSPRLGCTEVRGRPLSGSPRPGRAANQGPANTSPAARRGHSSGWVILHPASQTRLPSTRWARGGGASCSLGRPQGIRNTCQASPASIPLSLRPAPGQLTRRAQPGRDPDGRDLLGLPAPFLHQGHTIMCQPFTTPLGLLASSSWRLITLHPALSGEDGPSEPSARAAPREGRNQASRVQGRIKDTQPPGHGEPGPS